MSTYSLSGSGTHALTASTTGLQVTITTPSSIGGLGRSNPVARYDQGLIRFSDGTSYWPPVAILGGPQFIPVPANASSIGYALLGGAVVSVVEVIGGTLFFSASIPSVETLSDVQVASIADGQLLAWNAAASKWENVTPSSGPTGAVTLIGSQALLAPAASVTFSSIPSTYRQLQLWCLIWTNSGHAAGNDSLWMRFNNDSGSGHYYSAGFYGGSLGPASDSTSTDTKFDLAVNSIGGIVSPLAFTSVVIDIPFYAQTTTAKTVHGRTARADSVGGTMIEKVNVGLWNQSSAINQIDLLPSSGSWATNSLFALYGIS